MVRYILPVLIFFMFISCEKEEGVGGVATIKGIVFQQNLDKNLEKSGKPFTAVDKDIFISYGDNTTVDDKIETSPSGEFIFEFLTPGDYTIFTYSDDSSVYGQKETSIVSQVVTIKEKDEIITIDTLLFFKHVDIDEGNSIVSGKVYVQKLDMFLNPVGKPLPKGNEDVFISIGSTLSADDKAETSPDGAFSFSNLIHGNYSIFVYSDDQNHFNNDIESTIQYDFVINEDFQNVPIDSLIIFKHVDVDDGTGIASGIVRKVIYIDGTTIPIDTIEAQKTDVFLVYENAEFICLDTETDYNGNYTFRNLIPGSYKVYALSEQAFELNKLAEIKSFVITESSQNITIKPIVISDF